MKQKEKLSLLPLRGVLVFPNMVLHLDVGRQRSVTALERAMVGDNRILLIAQKDARVDEPVEEDLYNVGTVAEIKQMIKLPGGTIRVLVEGLTRARITRFIAAEPCFEVEAVIFREDDTRAPEVEALMRSVLYQFEQYIIQVEAGLAGLMEGQRLPIYSRSGSNRAVMRLAIRS